MKAIFQDRTEAGRTLAEKLLSFQKRKDVIVLGLPRGGVPVAYEVAKRLDAPLDVLVVRKLGMPGYEELAIGAIASGGARVLNTELIERYNIPAEAIESLTRREMKELTRREGAYRNGSEMPALEGKVVVLVDDGLATGSTMFAAVRAVAQRNPKMIVVAVPVAAPESFARLRTQVDKAVAVKLPPKFEAVGQWYADFPQTTDEEVQGCLFGNRQERENVEEAAAG